MTVPSDQLTDPKTVGSVEDAGDAGTPSVPRPRISWMALTIILSNLGLGTLALAGWIEFGSISSALGYLRGDRLIPDAYSKSFGTTPAGQTRTVEFLLTSYLSHPVKIIGFKSSCTCASASELPIEVPSSATVRLKVDVRPKTNQAGSSSGFPISESVRLYTDDLHLMGPILNVTGRLSP